MGRVFGNESQYPSAGKRWTDEEERTLIWHFEKKLTMDQLVGVLGRGPGGIFLRLKKLKLVPEELELERFDRYTGELWDRNTDKNLSPEKTYLKKRILEIWERKNWELNVDQRERFLIHPTLIKLLDLKFELIYHAINIIGLKKLDEIYGYVYGSQIEERMRDSHSSVMETYRKLKSKSKSRKRSRSEIKSGSIHAEDKQSKRSKARPNSERYVERNSRGPESLRKFGMVNPPPKKVPELKHTSLFKCSICGKAVVGNSCACDGW